MQAVITKHITRLSGLLVLIGATLDSLTNEKNAWRFKEYLGEIADYVILNGCPVSLETLCAIESEVAGSRLRNDIAYTDALWMIRQALKGRKREEMILMALAWRCKSPARSLYHAACWAQRVAYLPPDYHHPALVDLAKEVLTYTGERLANIAKAHTLAYYDVEDPLEHRAFSKAYALLMRDALIREFYESPAILELSIERVTAETAALERYGTTDHAATIRATHLELMEHFKAIA